MKYPGLPPAGSGPPGTAWALAGSALGVAVRLFDPPVDPAARVQLAEIRRRRFEVQDALAGLREGGGGATLPQLALAEANAWWTIGDVRQAMPRYRSALREWTETGDADGRLAALIGLARCDRVVLAGRDRSALAAALAAAPAVADEHLLADLHREEAGWALLSGDHVKATRLAEAAAVVHAGVGDEYLGGLADVLSAQAANAAGDDDAAITRILAGGRGFVPPSWQLTAIANPASPTVCWTATAAQF